MSENGYEKFLDMKAFKKVRSQLIPLDIANVDTDQIIPKQFLKLVQKSGYENYLFYDWRFNPDGSLKNVFVLNNPKYAGREVLLVRENFGCGSSREHAVWALFDYGFKVILGPSFADIFYNNCFKTGVLPIVLRRNDIEHLFNNSENFVEIDLMEQRVNVNERSIRFQIDPMRKKMLLEGLDEIGFTLQLGVHIARYEKQKGKGII
ncbi:MAG TPA: 3-isopropylmalate dehydratase small subunit [Nitrososphaeraceae archaeon]